MSANTPNLRAVHQFFELMKAKDIEGWAKLWANDGVNRPGFVGDSVG